MVRDKPAKKSDAAASFNDAWSRQWGDTSDERAKRQAEGKAQYDAIVEKKRKMDAEEDRANS